MQCYSGEKQHQVTYSRRFCDRGLSLRRTVFTYLPSTLLVGQNELFTRLDTEIHYNAFCVSNLVRRCLSYIDINRTTHFFDFVF